MKRKTTRRPKRIPKPYKSWLEYDLHTGDLASLEYEGTCVTYTINLPNRRYTPDFVSGDRLLEAKGRFRDTSEAQKYKQLQANGYNICFIFQNPKTPLAWAKRRRDGTKISHGEWATRNGFEWCSAKDIPEEWTKP